MNFTKFEVERIKEQYAWLIKLRWFAVLGVVGIFLIIYFFSLQFPYLLLQLFLGGLILHNLTSSWLIKLNKSDDPVVKYFFLKRITLYQILTDLVLLTILLHFSGGIENPFMLFYLFHAALTSILFSYRTSIVVGTCIIAMLSLLAFGEYSGLIAHYRINPNMNYYNDFLSVVTLLGIFSIAVYILIYLAGTITNKLRNQERAFYLINEELTHANAELAEKDVIKNEYVSRVTHDIKGHLASIQTLLAVIVLQDPAKTDGLRPDFVKKAYNRILLLNEFVKDLLKLTQMRLLNNQRDQIFSINTVLDKIYQQLLPYAQSKEIALIFKTQIPYSVRGEFTSIEEAIANIVSNAIKYTPVKGQVTVNLNMSQGTHVSIEVSDTGYGIPEEELPKIFEEFYRATNTQNLADGTGLGLSLVKQIIERHHGKVTVESKIGEGTKFTVLLPLINPE